MTLRTRLTVLALVLLLVAFGGYIAIHRIATKAGTLSPVAAQNAGGRNDSNASPTGARQGARPATSAVGPVLGATPTAAPDPKTAPDKPAEDGQPVAQPATPAGSTNSTPDAAEAGPPANGMGALLGALSTAVGGVHRHDPVDFHTLETLLPSTLPGMQAAAPAGNADETMSIKTTSAHVDFTGANGARIHLSIRDATAISGLAGLADMRSSNGAEQGDSYEKSETIDGRSVHERWDATARHGELSLSVAQRFAVDVVGDNVDMDGLKNALAHIDLATLESMKDANPQRK